MEKLIKVAAAQLAPVFLDRAACVEKACHTIIEAGNNGAQLVVFPEAYIPGYPYWALVLDPTSINAFQRKLFNEAVEIPSPSVDALCAAARQAGCYVVMGLHLRAGGTLYNAQLFINPLGEIMGVRRKLVPTTFERMVWGGGDGRDLEVFNTPFGILGGLMCYEHANALFRYALQGQGEQIHIAMWPGGMPSINGIIDAAVRHYAFEAQAFVISVSAVLTEDIIAALGAEANAQWMRPGGGCSAIVAPNGSYVVSPDKETEALLYADLDLDLIADAKMIVDAAGHYARPEVVQLVLHRASPQPLEIKEI